MLEEVQVESVGFDMSFKEFSALADWCIRSEKPGFLNARRLASAGLWESGDLTERGRELACGLVSGRLYFNALKYSATDMGHLMIWAGSAGMTCARKHSRGVRVWQAQACELPVILAHFMGFVPRVTYSCGPYVLPADIGRYVIQGNAAGLRLLLGEAGMTYEASPPQGEPAITPLSYGLSRELWELAVVQKYPFGEGSEEESRESSDQSLIYLMVPESMYVLRGQHDEVGNLVGYDVRATRPLMEWGHLIDMCGEVL